MRGRRHLPRATGNRLPCDWRRYRLDLSNGIAADRALHSWPPFETAVYSHRPPPIRRRVRILWRAQRGESSAFGQEDRRAYKYTRRGDAKVHRLRMDCILMGSVVMPASRRLRAAETAAPQDARTGWNGPRFARSRRLSMPAPDRRTEPPLRFRPQQQLNSMSLKLTADDIESSAATTA